VFDCHNAHFWKLCFEALQLPLLIVIKPYVESNLRVGIERGAQCSVTEILAGLLRAAPKHWPPHQVSQMWEYTIGVLSRSLQDIDNVSDWITGFRFATYNRDPRLFSPLINFFFENLFKGEASMSQAKSLQYIQSILLEVSWRSISLNESVLERLSGFLSHNSQQVREQISRTIAIIFANVWRPVESDSLKFAVFPPNNSNSEKTKWFVNFVKTQWDIIATTPTKSEQFVGTILNWLEFAFKSSDLGWSIKPYIKEFLPALFQTQEFPHPEICKQAKQVLGLVAQWALGDRTRGDEKELLVFTPLSQLSSHSNWHIRSAILPFLQIASFNNTFLIDDSGRSHVYGLVIDLLIDPQIEVRELASVALSSLIRTPSPHRDFQYCPENLIKKFQEMTEGSKIGSQQHGGVLGLASLVLSAPYSIPSWLPEALTVLGRFLNTKPPMQTTVKNAFREFWRTHQDMWEEHRDHFNQDQLDFLTQLQLSPSYYA